MAIRLFIWLWAVPPPPDELPPDDGVATAGQVLVVKVASVLEPVPAEFVANERKW